MGTHGIIFLCETNPILRKCGRIHRKADFKCHCGNIFNTYISAIKRDHATSCGCKKLTTLANIVRTHGLYKHPLYHVWVQIKERTENKYCKCYKNYGGRGITIFSIWKVDFQSFYDYVTALPNCRAKGYSLDRENNDGNYEPGNLRWASRHVQNSNARMQKSNTSGYVGVGKEGTAWNSRIGSNVRIGRFKTKEQAVTARNNYIIVNNLTEYKIQEIR